MNVVIYQKRNNRKAVFMLQQNTMNKVQTWSLGKLSDQFVDLKIIINFIIEILKSVMWFYKS